MLIEGKGGGLPCLLAAATIQALLDLLVLLVSIVRLVNELRLLLWDSIAMVVQAG